MALEVAGGLALLLVYPGRAVCQARVPNCGECVLWDLCPTGRGSAPRGHLTTSPG